jgi:chromosome partitioning protein
MIRLVIANQRGGVAKTTSTLSLAWNFAELGKRVLIVDTDPQASVSELIGIRPEKSLFHFLITQEALEVCATHTSHPKIDVLASNRETNKAEDLVSTQTAREFAFEHTLRGAEDRYDVVLLDCAPSIGLFQACAMVYARHLLIPVAMETLSVQGAMAAIQSAVSLSHLLRLNPNINIVGIMPVMVDKRLQITGTVLNALPQLCQQASVPLLPGVRTDTTVAKAGRARKFIAEFDPRSKAIEDYQVITDHLLRVLEAGSGSSSAEGGVVEITATI